MSPVSKKWISHPINLLFPVHQGINSTGHCACSSRDIWQSRIKLHPVMRNYWQICDFWLTAETRASAALTIYSSIICFTLKPSQGLKIHWFYLSFSDCKLNCTRFHTNKQQSRLKRWNLFDDGAFTDFICLQPFFASQKSLWLESKTRAPIQMFTWKDFAARFPLRFSA